MHGIDTMQSEVWSQFIWTKLTFKILITIQLIRKNNIIHLKQTESIKELSFEIHCELRVHAPGCLLMPRDGDRSENFVFF